VLSLEFNCNITRFRTNMIRVSKTVRLRETFMHIPTQEMPPIFQVLICLAQILGSLGLFYFRVISCFFKPKGQYLKKIKSSASTFSCL